MAPTSRNKNIFFNETKNFVKRGKTNLANMLLFWLILFYGTKASYLEDINTWNVLEVTTEHKHRHLIKVNKQNKVQVQLSPDDFTVKECFSYDHLVLCACSAGLSWELCAYNLSSSSWITSTTWSWLKPPHNLVHFWYLWPQNNYIKMIVQNKNTNEFSVYLMNILHPESIEKQRVCLLGYCDEFECREYNFIDHTSVVVSEPPACAHMAQPFHRVWVDIEGITETKREMQQIAQDMFKGHVYYAVLFILTFIIICLFIKIYFFNIPIPDIEKPPSYI
jgi:hypothetical protein